MPFLKPGTLNLSARIERCNMIVHIQGLGTIAVLVQGPETMFEVVARAQESLGKLRGKTFEDDGHIYWWKILSYNPKRPRIALKKIRGPRYYRR